MGLSAEDLEHDLIMFKREVHSTAHGLTKRIDDLGQQIRELREDTEMLRQSVGVLIGDLDELRKKVTPTGA